jgi:hypothetical protein
VIESKHSPISLAVGLTAPLIAAPPVAAPQYAARQL